MTLTLSNPIRVGDLMNEIMIAQLNLVSVSINFANGPAPVVSIILKDLTSGYTWNLVLTAGTRGPRWRCLPPSQRFVSG